MSTAFLDTNILIYMRAGLLEASQPGPAQALLLAAAVARRRGRLRAIPLPVWAISGGSRPAVLPLQDPVAWPAAFLGRVAAAAQRGLGDLARLRDAEAVARRLAGAGRRSLLPEAAEVGAAGAGGDRARARPAARHHTSGGAPTHQPLGDSRCGT